MPGESMIQTIRSAAVTGLDVRRVRVEVSITRGTPMIQIVGLAHGAVREGRERIRAAASQLGLHVPGLRITVNLAPADIPKGGAAFDLPIILGILAAAGELPAGRLARTLFAGELSLDGGLRAIRGALPIALDASRDPSIDRLVLPLGNAREAAAAQGIEVSGARTLTDVIRFARGDCELPGPEDAPVPPRRRPHPGLDLSSVLGQAAVKRALEIAAAGGHNLLMSGPPGSGKTTLARCLPGLMPPLSSAEAVEVTALHSVAGLLAEGAGLVDVRPFRAPHHTVSETGLIGGGSVPRPGEASLAHHGVLFLDELPEFRRGALEALRQPLEEGWVRIVRARATATFPARFALVAAMNPCPCGHAGEDGRCRCGDAELRRYRRKLSGPLLDRIDLHVDVPALTWDELAEAPAAESSAAVRSRVEAARLRAARRVGHPGRPNASLTPGELTRHCALDGASSGLLRLAVERLSLSARGYHRTLRLARTIADLAGREAVTEDCVAEAIGYRGAETVVV